MKETNNYNSFQNLTNYIQVSPEFSTVPFLLQRVNVPGLTTSINSISNRGRNRVNVQADTVEFNDLEFEMLIDENFKVWLEFQKYLRDKINKDGSFKADQFQFTLQINNNKGNKLFCLEFNDCRLSSIGDIQLDTTQEESNFTLPVGIVYDSYDITQETTIDPKIWQNFFELT